VGRSFGELHEARAQSTAARRRIYADRLDVADERAAHVQDDESPHLAVHFGRVNLARRILQQSNFFHAMMLS